MSKTVYPSGLRRPVVSGYMGTSTRSWTAAAAATAALVAALVAPAVASGQPDTTGTTGTAVQPAPAAPDVLHNVIYRARADGTSRGAIIAYKMDDENVNSAQPNLLPGQTFEINAVLADPTLAGMELSIEWPYGSNLHCEILVDDQVVAKADQFIAPRLLRPKDDPLYGVLQCGAPLNLPIDGVAPPATDPVPQADVTMPPA